MTESASPSAVTDVERKPMSRLSSTSSSIVCSMFARSSSSSGFMPPVPSRTRSEVASASSVRLGASVSSVALHSVTWMSRSWPALATAPVLDVCTDRIPSSGPSM